MSGLAEARAGAPSIQPSLENGRGEVGFVVLVGVGYIIDGVCDMSLQNVGVVLEGGVVTVPSLL